MVKRVILGDEFALFLYNFIKNYKVNKIFKMFIVATICLIIFTLIVLLLVVGTISLIKHISNYEVIMGICCVTYSLFFIITFLKKTIYLITQK